MALPFLEPKPALRYDPDAEVAALDEHFVIRGVPAPRNDRLLLATWNIANLGAHRRPPRARRVIAHILGRFDLVAVQEVNDDFRTFLKVLEHIDGDVDFIMSDTAGNDERLAFVFRSGKVRPDKLWGEIALTKRQYPRRTVKVRYKEDGQDKVQTFRRLRFVPFDRNPFVGSFRSGSLAFVLANVHLLFGARQNSRQERDRAKYARRVLEIFALARWAKRVSESGNAWNPNIVLIGDMNVPNMERDESTIKALRSFGWTSVDYLSDRTAGVDARRISRIGGTNLGNDRTYDQIAFSSSHMERRICRYGVFDFDNAIFRSKWTSLDAAHTRRKAIGVFNRYVRHHISDHRPLWMELRTGGQ